MRIVTNDEMRAVDDRAIQEIGIPSLILMENAGLEAANLISNICKQKKYEGEVLVFAGKGKNAGDGLVVARRLIANGHKVRIFLLHDPKDYTGESATHLKVLKNFKAKISYAESASVIEEYFKSANPPYFVVDALVGTGLKRNIEGIYYDAINLINLHGDEIFALDIPSGVHGDSGAIANTSVRATHTISFGYPKLGHFLAPGAAHRGKLYHVDLNFPPSWQKEGTKFLLNFENTAPLLQLRDKYGHKNSFGHCLLIGGSPGRTGAIVMASNSCLKMGTGLVTVASWEDSYPALEMKLSSEIMNLKIIRQGDEYNMPKPGLSAFSSLVVGPGLGLREQGKHMLEQLLLRYPGPMVVDADGLNMVAEHGLFHLLNKRPQPTVLTPHPGEMARLLGVEKDKVTSDPVWAVKQASEKTGTIVVLKGATTLIHSPGGTTWFNHYPNDGMATAGSGDVLAGMIGGLLGQHMDALEATKLGVMLHSLAGRFAAESCGHRAMTATDITDNIKTAFHAIRTFETNKILTACTELY